MMTVWFVSRHPGAIAWAKNQGLPVDRWVTHLNAEDVAAGDLIVGTLPMTAAGIVCEKGARFFSLEVRLAEHQRGRELSEDELKHLNCTLQEFKVQRIAQDALAALCS